MSASGDGAALRQSRAQRAQRLLGADAPIARGKPRRVPSKGALEKAARAAPGPSRGTRLGADAPLLNCTAESRRQAEAARAARGARPAAAARGAAPAAAEAAVATALAAAAAAAVVRLGLLLGAWPPRAAGWGVVAFLAARHAAGRRADARRAAAAAAVAAAAPAASPALACWGGRPERAPPLPLPELPDALADVDEPWMAEAGVPARWVESERRFLARCRREFAAEFAAAPPYPDVYGDRRLLRVLRMDPDRDEARAVAKVGDYLRWRRERGADAMRARVPELGFAPARWPHGETLYACLRLLQCSERYFDRDGHAVTVYQAFHWPAPALRRHLCALPTEALLDFVCFAAEYNGSQMERISRAREAVVLADARRRFEERRRRGERPDDPPLLEEGWGEVTRLCAITDMAGCTFGSIMMPTLLPAVIQAVKIFLNYYPFIVGRLHVINCQSTVAAVFRRALTSIVPEHVARQITVHPIGSRDIFRQIAAEHLPVQLGGAAPCPELAPPPPPPDAAAAAAAAAPAAAPS